MMLRRLQSNTIANSIGERPEPQTILCEFSDPEREFYDLLENQDPLLKNLLDRVRECRNDGETVTTTGLVWSTRKRQGTLPVIRDLVMPLNVVKLVSIQVWFSRILTQRLISTPFSVLQGSVCAAGTYLLCLWLLTRLKVLGIFIGPFLAKRVDVYVA
jgi:hypothetical protein